MNNELYCPACKEMHDAESRCWWMDHHLRNPGCRCQWCHAIAPLHPSTVDVSYIREYGLTQKLSNQVRVY